MIYPLAYVTLSSNLPSKSSTVHHELLQNAEKYSTYSFLTEKECKEAKEDLRKLLQVLREDYGASKEIGDICSILINELSDDEELMCRFYLDVACHVMVMLVDLDVMVKRGDVSPMEVYEQYYNNEENEEKEICSVMDVSLFLRRQIVNFSNVGQIEKYIKREKEDYHKMKALIAKGIKLMEENEKREKENEKREKENEKRIKDLEKKITDQEKTIKEQEKEIKELKEKMIYKYKEINDLKEKIADQEKKLTKVKERVSTLEKENEDLKESYKRLEDLKEVSDSRVTQYLNQSISYSGKLSKLDKDFKRKQEQNKRREEELRESLAIAKERIAQYEKNRKANEEKKKEQSPSVPTQQEDMKEVKEKLNELLLRSDDIKKTLELYRLIDTADDK